MQTLSGIRFEMLGDRGDSPTPTLFNFASDTYYSLREGEYNKAGFILREYGYLCVSLDLPHHGSGVLQGYPEGLPGWAAEIGGGDAMVPEFVSKVSEVLDYLIEEGYTDPERVAVAGTSRGGFIAMHAAVADPRFGCVVGFAPVTDLAALSEFDDLHESRIVKSLALTNNAEKLVERSVWIGIGNNDQRVSTDRAIEFTRRIVALSAERNRAADVELHVMPWPGHGCPLSAHEEAAEWVLTRLGDSVHR